MWAYITFFCALLLLPASGYWIRRICIDEMDSGKKWFKHALRLTFWTPFTCIAAPAAILRYPQAAALILVLTALHIWLHISYDDSKSIKTAYKNSRTALIYACASYLIGLAALAFA